MRMKVQSGYGQLHHSITCQANLKEILFAQGMSDTRVCTIQETRVIDHAHVPTYQKLPDLVSLGKIPPQYNVFTITAQHAVPRHLHRLHSFDIGKCHASGKSSCFMQSTVGSFDCTEQAP